MNKLKLYAALLVAGLLIGCTSSNEGNGSIGDVIPVDNSSSSSSSSGGIANTPLPVQEDFGSYTAFDRGDTVNFFSSNYRALATNVPADPEPSFYYPTCCFDPAMPDRMWITNVSSNASLLLSNARFTIGQTLSETLANPVAADKKITSTPGNATSETGSWGELNLSSPYKISFCVLYASGTGNFEMYVDNNSGGTSTASIHLGPSRINQIQAGTLVAGQRHSVLSSVGDENSFIQFRVSSGGTVLIDDLWIGYQSDTSTEPSGAMCAAANSAAPPAVPTDLVLTAGDTEIEASWASSAFPFATGYDVAYNTTNSTSGATVVNVASGTSTTLTGLTNGQQYFVFVRGKNTNGDSAYSASSSATPSAPVTPPGTPAAPTLTAGDTEIDVTIAAVTGATSYDIIYNTINDTAGATDFAGNPVSGTTATITGLTNGTEYFVFVRAKNSAGDSAYSPGASATPAAPSGGTTTAIPFTEDFSAADQATYFSAAYKSLSDDAGAPLNNITGGGSNIVVSGGTLTFNNGRFTIGDKDPGTLTTAATQHAGDFDLSQPYTITFDVITNANTGGNFAVYVDNNTTSSGASVHSTIGSTASRIFQKSAATMADGDTSTGTVTINSSVGTATSFIQIRADSGVTSPITIDNLTITYQPVTTPLPFTEDFSAADQATYFSAAYKALSDDAGAPLNNITGGGSNIVVSGGTLTFNNGRFTIGDKDPGTLTTAATQHAGDFDLSQPYRITFDIITNANTGGNFAVYVDNNTTSSGASVHSTIGSTASRIFQKPAATAADGDTATGTVTIDSSVGTATSFIQIRTDSAVTSPITIDNLVIDYQ